MKKRFRPTIFWVYLLASLPAQALGPMYSSHDLVAGEGMGGWEDGPFYSALFQNPTGIAVDPSEDKLYVADKGNHRLRVIDLSQENRVSTLTGGGKAGFVDGPLNKALFNLPTLLTALPNRRLVVWDQGNNRIRLVDLARKSVSTLAGGTMGDGDGIGAKAQLGTIWSMAYLESQDALYFSQPNSGTLRRLSLQTGEVATLIKGDSRIPKPAALGVNGGKLYLADQALAQGFELTPKGDKGEFDWKPIPCGVKTLSLAWSDHSLYALQADAQSPVSLLLPNPHPVCFYDPWGNKLTLPERDAFFSEAARGSTSGLVPDPAAPRRFFLAHPGLNMISSIRDLDEGELMGNESWHDELMDFNYPTLKPPHVFRILLVGDSHVFHNDNPDGTNVSNRMALTAKRLENNLNAMAALEDGPARFEVLTLAHISSFPLDLWPYYEVPPVAQNYDIDMVLFLAAPYNPDLNIYFERPLTGDHIPAKDPDPEYMLKPAGEKLKDPAVKDLVNLCLAKKWATEDKQGDIHFADVTVLSQDSEIRSKAAELYARPLKLLRQKLLVLNSKKTSIPWITCLAPPAHFASYRFQKSFWEAVAQDIGGPALDLSDDWAALRISYYPLSEIGGYDHYNGHGHELLAFLIAHGLIGNRWIPWGLSKPGH